MTVNSEQMSGEPIAAGRMRDRYELGDVEPTSDDAGQPMRYLGIVSAALEETDADRRAELAVAGERLRAAEAELAGVPESDAVAAEATAAETKAAPVVEDAVRTASYAAARLLEIATRNADALVEDAREEADQTLTQARAQAEQMIQSSLAEAKARDETMSARAEAQRVELDRARHETLRQLEERWVELDAKVNQLVEFESQCRSQLISYLNDQVQTLHGPTIAETLTMAEAEDSQPS